MKSIGDMLAEEVGGLVCQALHDAGVTVTLTGGACVAIWSNGKHVSEDLDFVRVIQRWATSENQKEKFRQFKQLLRDR